MSIQRGDVILCRLPLPSAGLTQFKLRPAVVVSKDDNNQRLVVGNFRLRIANGELQFAICYSPFRAFDTLCDALRGA